MMMIARFLQIFMIALIPVSSIFSQGVSRSSSGSRPVSDSIFMGDPFMLYDNGRYYLYGTTSSGTGFKCWSAEARDIPAAAMGSGPVPGWKYEGFVFRENADSWGQGNYWAPEVYHYNGKYYMVYSCKGKDTTNNRMLLCLASADSPAGPFRDVHAPWFDPGYSCIDGHIFFDNDGKIYLYYDKVGYEGTWPGGHLFGYILCRELSHDLSPVSGPVFCSKAEQEWEHPLSDRSRCNEGCSVIRHNGTYYMTYSANHYQDPYYGIGYSTASSPFGPWTKDPDNPVVGMDEDAGIYGPGHNSFVTSPDSSELYMVYHRHVSKEDTRRRVYIGLVHFDKTGKMTVER